MVSLLSGRWSGHRVCHIEPDWIVIYRVTADDLYLKRTGSHAGCLSNRDF
ncbi:MAG: type II toxin-antitoxin system mRNA interferase toxin, RelE/StbE family [Desulfobacterales bacterium]